MPPQTPTTAAAGPLRGTATIVLPPTERRDTIPHGVTLVPGGWALAGPALRWVRRLDAAIVDTAERWGAQELELGPPVGRPAGVPSTSLPGFGALRTVRGQSLGAPHLITTRGSWLPSAGRRVAASPAPHLTRDIVVVGTRAECQLFLHLAWGAVDQLRDWLELPMTWGRHDDQREALVGHLVVCSTYRHGAAATSVLGLTRGRGPAHSACLSVHPDRMVMAMTRRWGPDTTVWPDPLSGTQVLAALREG